MAESIKVLAQSCPGNTTLAGIYTVPASPATAATLSSITVCNLSAAVRTFDISIAVNNATDDAKQYIFKDQEIDANSNFSATIGITLGPGDVLKVRSSFASSLAFNIFGIEVS